MPFFSIHTLKFLIWWWLHFWLLRIPHFSIDFTLALLQKVELLSVEQVTGGKNYYLLWNNIQICTVNVCKKTALAMKGNLMFFCLLWNLLPCNEVILMQCCWHLSWLTVAFCSLLEVVADFTWCTNTEALLST